MCVFLALVIAVPVNATRIELLREDKAALGAIFSNRGLGFIIEKNLGKYSDYPNEELRLTAQTFYGDQVLGQTLGLQWKHLSGDFGYWGGVHIYGGYHTGYEDLLDTVIAAAEGGLFMPLGAVTPWISAIYNYHYDTYFNSGESVLAAGVGVDINLSERLCVHIRGEGFTDNTNTDFTVSVIYHSWD